MASNIVIEYKYRMKCECVQMRLMFGRRGCAGAGGRWVALLVTLHAHRASCRALHTGLASLLSRTSVHSRHLHRYLYLYYTSIS